MAKGETVKYIIDADVSAFIRGMLEADTAAKAGGKSIDRSLSSTSKKSENNFKDIQKNASKTASSIRSFGTALQGFNTTSLIIGITALSGAVLELSGALAAAGSTASILAPALAQGAAATATFETGISGLGAAFKAISANDGKAFAASMVGLGPAAKSVAVSAAVINKAFNGVKLNVQQALFAGLGDTILRLGSTILPTLNVGMQKVAQSFNSAFKSAASLASTPIFQGLISTIFADTAKNVDVLSGALSPLLTIFTNLYLVTRPYVSLLAVGFVNLLKQAAAYSSTAKGQSALNLAIQEGLVAIKELGQLAGAVFGLLTSVFRTSVNAGNSLIPTLTGIIKKTEGWVNSAKGQQDLINLFNFTSLALQNVAHSIGLASQLFFGIINLISSLTPGVQALVLQFLSLALAIGPIGGYFSKLFGSVKLVAVTIFNLSEQLVVVFGALGAFASIALILAGGLIILGAVIKGPVGAALIIVGVAIAAFIGLSYLLTSVNGATATSFFELGFAALDAGVSEVETAGASALLGSTMYAVAAAGLDAAGGLTTAASGAEILQASILPLLVLAAGVVLILSMLGVFNSKAKTAQSATSGFGTSLTALQKSMAGVGSTGNKTANNGLSALNDSLNSVGTSADAAQGSLASFDKMNVLTDNSAAGAGIPGLGTLPNFDGTSLGAPTLDTTAFDKALKDMQGQFDGLGKDIGKPIANPFAALGTWIDSHPWIALAGFIVILLAVGAAFVLMGLGVDIALSPLLLIVIAVIAIIAIIILLAQNWTTIWAGIQIIVGAVGDFIVGVFTAVGSFIGGIVSDIVGFFSGLFSAISTIFSPLVQVFIAIFTLIKDAVILYIDIVILTFALAWKAIVAVWDIASSFFAGVFNDIVKVFTPIIDFFVGIFSSVFNGIKNIFGDIVSFFSGVIGTIVGVFVNIGTAIANAIGGAFKTVVNDVLGAVQTVINAPINTINSLIKKINSVPGIPNLPVLSTITLPRLAKGGVVDSPTIAQLGENGQEAVMPLENNTQWIDKLANKINAAGGTTGQPVNVTVELDGTKLGNIIIDRINEKTQMSGRNSILV